MKRTIVLISLIAFAQSALGQGFMNFGFESATLAGYQPNDQVPIVAALPGWTGYFTPISGPASPASAVSYGGISLGGACISIIDANANYGARPIAGNYSVFLAGGAGRSATICQTGTVPEHGTSLLFDVSDYGTWQDAADSVSFGGQPIAMRVWETHSGYTTYAGDLSPFAGETGELKFTVMSPELGGPNMLLFDNVRITSLAVPEPSTLAIFILSGMVFSLRSKRVSKQRQR